MCGISTTQIKLLLLFFIIINRMLALSLLDQQANMTLQLWRHLDT